MFVMIITAPEGISSRASVMRPSFCFVCGCFVWVGGERGVCGWGVAFPYSKNQKGTFLIVISMMKAGEIDHYWPC